jgi:hypothetical protein
VAVTPVVVLLAPPRPSVTVSATWHVTALPAATPAVSTSPPGPAAMVGVRPVKLWGSAEGHESTHAYVQLATPHVLGAALAGTWVVAPANTVTL